MKENYEKTISELKKEKFPELTNEKNFKNNILRLSSNKTELLYTRFLRESTEDYIGTLFFEVLNNRNKINNIIDDYIKKLCNMSVFNFDDIIMKKDFYFSNLDYFGENFQFLIEQLFTDLIQNFDATIKSITTSSFYFNKLLKEEKTNKKILEEKLNENKLELEKYTIYNFITDNMNIKSSINSALDSVDDFLLEESMNYILDIPRMKIYKKLNEEVIYFELKDFYDLINAYIYYFHEKNIYLRKCKNCGKYFIRNGKQKYCDNIYKNGYTCRNIPDDMRNKSDETPQFIYRKAYTKNIQRRNKNKEANKNIKNKFNLWNCKAVEMRDKCQSGVISIEEYKNWIDNNDNWDKKEVK